MVDESPITAEQFEAEVAPVVAKFHAAAETAARVASDRLYENILGDVQDYLVQNVQWNLSQIITRNNTLAARVIELEAEVARLREVIAPTLADCTNDECEQCETFRAALEAKP